MYFERKSMFFMNKFILASATDSFTALTFEVKKVKQPTSVNDFNQALSCAFFGSATS